MTFFGILFILYGPSGVGKTTLARRLLQDKELQLSTVCSYTTRHIRPGESEGADYYFICPQEFEQKIKDGFFLEWSNEYGSYYGCAKKEVENILSEGRDVLLVLDYRGVQEAKKQLAKVIAIQIRTSSLTVLRERILKRSQLSQQELEFRLKKAEEELQKEEILQLADHFIVNNDLDSTFEGLKSIIKVEKNNKNLNKKENVEKSAKKV